MTGERGQALLVAALVIAAAAVAVVGLRDQQERLVAFERERRAGEAAAAAAAAATADAYVAELRAAAERTPPSTPDVNAALGDPRARERARVAASELSLGNGGPAVDEVRIVCANGQVDVTVVLRGTSFRAGFEAPECSPR